MNPADVLPQRDPFLLLDSIQSVEPGVNVSASWSVEPSAWFLDGLNGRAPKVPTTYVLEALGQASSVIASTMPEMHDKYVIFGGFRAVRLGPATLAPCSFDLSATALGVTESGMSVTCSAASNGREVATASLVMAFVDPQQIGQRSGSPDTPPPTRRVDPLAWDPPHLLLTRVSVSEDVATGVWVMADDHFFKGHFPGFPVTTAALLMEAAAQTATAFVAPTHHCEFRAAQRMKFRKQTGPGVTVTFAVTVTERDDTRLDANVEITADGEPVSSFVAEFAVAPDAV